MPSFSKMSHWPVGYFRSVAAWLLRERRDAAVRVAVISAEMARIGFVTIDYTTVREGESSLKMETPNGISVTAGSSLARLVQAYVANGGNPFAICGFLHPDQTRVSVDASGRAVYTQEYPGDGIVAPQSVAYNDPVPELVTSSDGKKNAITGDDEKDPVKTGYEGYGGGMPATDRHYPGRMGRAGRGSWDDGTVVRTMHEMRSWANQTIKERLQDAEWRIVKLSDLYEQLKTERDQVLVQAFGDTLYGMTATDNVEQYDKALMLQCLVSDMNALIFEKGENGIPGTAPSTDVGHLRFTFEDRPSDVQREV